tara:strand:- start:2271 stop:3362 length:1092 start_codon:yes stop_codon:yes gene_type:complete
MIKIAYISRVAVPNRVAQAEQILSMSRAFYDILNDDFLLICTKTNEDLDRRINFKRKIIDIKTKNKVLRNILFAFKVYLFLKRNKPKYIYTRDILISVVSCIFFKIPTFYEAHQPLRSFYSKFLQYVLSKNKSYSLITITNSLKLYYQKRLNYRNKINVIPNGVYLPDYNVSISKKQIRAELKIEPNDFVIVHTGSLFENRGFEKFKIILKSFPTIKLIQLGGKENDIQKLKLKLFSYPNIEFIDYQPKNIVVKYQLAADILFYITSTMSPIHWCTSPNKIFEYMSTKNPILAPRIGSIVEILNDSNSYLFDINNDNDMIEKIKKIMNLKNDEVVNNAYDEVKNIYSMEKRVQKILRLSKNEK